VEDHLAELCHGLHPGDPPGGDDGPRVRGWPPPSG
jgi:hypothetical protein